MDSKKKSKRRRKRDSQNEDEAANEATIAVTIGGKERRKTANLKIIMAFIGSDGTIGGKEQKTISRRISDFFAGILGFISLFFSAITNPPSLIESGRGTNYAQRNNNNSSRRGGGGSGGSNIRGVKNLQGKADAKMGGG
mmetsp:Transcript_53400/g.59725  ORF Transcript_53400/g.59725 Transcript_53400/m.59725 type:complete len:139 (-) Transcript_53400:609-1025(-)